MRADSIDVAEKVPKPATAQPREWFDAVQRLQAAVQRRSSSAVRNPCSASLDRFRGRQTVSGQTVDPDQWHGLWKGAELLLPSPGSGCQSHLCLLTDRPTFAWIGSDRLV